MKLNRVEKKSDQTYPIFDEYWENRRKYLSEVALCAGVVISAGTLASCTQKDTRIMGEMVEPQPPAQVTPSQPSKLPGEMVAPAKPEEPTPTIRGKIKAPEKPQPAPMPETPMIDGGMPAPAPPAPENIPALKGDIIAPAPPKPVEPVDKTPEAK